MNNPHVDSYGRRLLTSAVHFSNRDRFLRDAETSKNDGNFDHYKWCLEQADRSNQLGEAMADREALAREA